MKLSMPGTGSALGYRYHTNSCLIELPNYTLLIDCGETTPLGLYEMGYDICKLDGILISHIHADHVNGLEKLAWTMRYKAQKKIDLIGETHMLQRLWENTLKGGLEEAEEGILNCADLFTLRPVEFSIPSVPFEIAPSLSVEFVQTEHIHNKASYSFIINKTLFYSADMRFNPDLLRQLIAGGVTTILHDCQLHNDAPVHASLQQLLTLPPNVQQIIWLMHYGDNMEDFQGKSGKMRFLEQGKTYSFS